MSAPTYTLFASRLRSLSRDLAAVSEEFSAFPEADQVRSRAAQLSELSDRALLRTHLDPLPEGQARVLAFIQQHIAAHDLPPTRHEIAKALGFRSANAAQEHLQTMARKGVLKLFPGMSRGIKVLR
jgi:hypothetical protein